MRGLVACAAAMGFLGAACAAETGSSGGPADSTGNTVPGGGVMPVTTGTTPDPVTGTAPDSNTPIGMAGQGGGVVEPPIDDMVDQGLAGADAPPPVGACTGKPGAMRGKTDQNLLVAGVMRRFVMYAPATLDPNTPAPVVIAPHGFTMSGQAMYEITGYDKIADREGFVVLYPDGEGALPWNVGVGVCGVGAIVSAGGDDQGFVNGMLDFVAADQCVDDAHVFMSGFSMGGYFSNETGCQNSRIHAVGPHSGGSHDLAACPNTKMPVIVFHGDADALIAPTCGSEARDRWGARNGCMPASAGVDTRMVQGGQCEYSKGCPDGAQVALCSFAGMGHGWAGGTVGTSPGASYAFPNYENASELGWAFFKEFGW